jgi:hypothetical protein
MPLAVGTQLFAHWHATLALLLTPVAGPPQAPGEGPGQVGGTDEAGLVAECRTDDLGFWSVATTGQRAAEGESCRLQK